MTSINWQEALLKISGEPQTRQAQEAVDDLLPYTVTSREFDLIRQWFNAVHDINRAYLKPEDYRLMIKIAMLCKFPISEEYRELAEKKP